jgi:hypothetical protein
MRALLIITLGLLATAGCRNLTGPRENKSRPGPDPLLSIEEQKRYSKERYSYIEDDPTLTPNGFTGRPSPTGR